MLTAMELFGQGVALLLGVSLVLLTLLSVLRTLMLPRSAPDELGRLVFVGVRSLFMLRLRGTSDYLVRDRVMAYYAPVGLLILAVVWLLLVAAGYALVYWALGVPLIPDAFTLSGSSLLTLGFASDPRLLITLLAFSEATLGLILVALFIAYLPTMYTAFARREAAVALLEVRAGAPPSAVTMIERFYRIGKLPQISEQWIAWENWFADIEESHTSFAILAFFRSPQPERSWVTAAGAVLDAAALVNSTLDIEHDPQADLCIRAGYLALRRIADFFFIPYNANPAPDDPISITRAEFDAVYERLAAEGIAVKPDCEQAWRDFAGWRVNYDTVLLALAGLTMAPYAPWSSDRALAYRRPPLRRPGRG